MAPRPNWKGHLKLSLVSCAVALFPAISTEQRVRFNILSRATGHRVRYDVVDAETGDPVPEDERVKGYKIEGELANALRRAENEPRKTEERIAAIEAPVVASLKIRTVASGARALSCQAQV